MEALAGLQVVPLPHPAQDAATVRHRHRRAHVTLYREHFVNSTNFVNLVIFVKHNSVKFVKTTYIGCPVVALGLAADADGHIVPAVLVVAVLAVVTTVTSILLVLVPDITSIIRAK